MNKIKICKIKPLISRSWKDWSNS